VALLIQYRENRGRCQKNVTVHGLAVPVTSSAFRHCGAGENIDTLFADNSMGMRDRIAVLKGRDGKNVK